VQTAQEQFGSSRYLPPDVLQSCREAVEGQIKAGVEVNSTLLHALWRGIIVEAGLVSDRWRCQDPNTSAPAEAA
jgi:hypothetical protein